MKDTRLLHLLSHVESALEIGNELRDEKVPSVMEGMRLDLIGRLLVDARRHTVSMFEEEQ
jgi:hypothetical protein